MVSIAQKKLAIRTENLCKTYAKGEACIHVLQDISLSVPKGSKAVITGASGSGKTTLLSVISGLDNADSGNIVVSDYNISQSTERERALFRLKNVGFVFQYHYLLEDFTALENVMLPLQMLGYKRKATITIASDIIAKIGLFERKHHYPSQLSGGECQRVAVARSLVHNPDVIFVDEPTGALDGKNSDIIRQLLENLVQEYACTVFIATHDKDFLSMADIHYHLKNGNIHKDAGANIEYVTSQND